MSAMYGQRFFHQAAGTSFVSDPRTASAMTSESGTSFVVWGMSAEIWATQNVCVEK
jgi:hypothetical protein